MLHINESFHCVISFLTDTSMFLTIFLRVQITSFTFNHRTHLRRLMDILNNIIIYHLAILKPSFLPAPKLWCCQLLLSSSYHLLWEIRSLQLNASWLLCRWQPLDGTNCTCFSIHERFDEGWQTMWSTMQFQLLHNKYTDKVLKTS